MKDSIVKGDGMIEVVLLDPIAKEAPCLKQTNVAEKERSLGPWIQNSMPHNRTTENPGKS